jgi:hypothetical protein
VFKYVFGYRGQKNVTARVNTVKTASYFFDAPDAIIIVPNIKFWAEFTQWSDENEAELYIREGTIVDGWYQPSELGEIIDAEFYDIDSLIEILDYDVNRGVESFRVIKPFGATQLQNIDGARRFYDHIITSRFWRKD